MRPRIRLRTPPGPRQSSTARTPVLKAAQDALAADEVSGALRVDARAKTVSAAGTTLPLSPVMDRDFLERARRPRAPKPRPAPRPVGRFRALLADNIYGSFVLPFTSF